LRALASLVSFGPDWKAGIISKDISMHIITMKYDDGGGEKGQMI
jgi:hypothetical protein